MAVSRRRPFRLRGPKEADIQALTLRSLGRELRVPVQSKKTGKWRIVGTGLFISPDRKAYYWRANSGRRPYDYTTKDGKTGRGLFKAAPIGTADILGVCCGVPMAFEIKRDEHEHQTPEQREWQAMHEAAGGRYWVIRSPNEARSADAEVRQARAA
jgi:hypothetical protein